MKGIYLLTIYLETDKTIHIGKLGKLEFNKGYYIYVGSALNGLDQRIQRHLRKHKKLYWHIDYLLKHAKITDVFYKESNIREECIIAKKLEKELFSIHNFGCSDCTCKSHLFYGSHEEIMNVINNLKMKKYLTNAKY